MDLVLLPEGNIAGHRDKELRFARKQDLIYLLVHRRSCLPTKTSW